MTIPQIFLLGYILAFALGFVFGWGAAFIEIKSATDAKNNWYDRFHAQTANVGRLMIENLSLRVKLNRLTPKRDPIGRFMGKK